MNKQKGASKKKNVAPPAPTADELVSFCVVDARKILKNAGLAPSIIAHCEAGNFLSTGAVPHSSFDAATGMIRGSDRAIYAAEYLRCVSLFRQAMLRGDLEGVAHFANDAGGLQVLMR